ncbi:MAG: hypothetical protein GEEBNDBF_01210 [bacterium]|nr:hypothetical protein [bacterium]
MPELPQIVEAQLAVAGARMPVTRRTVVRTQVRGWRGVAEFLIERFLQINAFIAIALIGLIFVFLFTKGLDAFKVFTTPVDAETALEDTAIGHLHAAAIDRGDTTVLLKEPVELSEYLGEVVTEQHFDAETEEFTTTERYARMWQPNSDNPKYSMIPLLCGSLLVALPATLIATLLGLGVAIFLSEVASKKAREIIKPAIELLAGIPTVVLGFLLLMVFATPLQDLLNLNNRLNGMLGALGVAFVIIPVVATIAEDSLRAVPKEIRQGSLALGATKWQTLIGVVIPAAISGITAAVILGFGRALGETMIVLMATGNAAVVTLNPFESVRTMTATIAAELGAVDQVGNWYYSLFLVGALLFTITFIFNAIAESVVGRMRAALTGSGDL